MAEKEEEQKRGKIILFNAIIGNKKNLNFRSCTKKSVEINFKFNKNDGISKEVIRCVNVN